MDSTTQKVVDIRHGRANQYGFLCVVETPEGIKLVYKNILLLWLIENNMPSQVVIIEDFLKGKLINIFDVHPYAIKSLFKVFINGNWLGYTNKVKELYDFLKEERS